MTLGVLEALQRGDLVVLPNQRSEQYWSTVWLKQQEAQALPGNRLYAFNRWLRSLWQQHPKSLFWRLLSERQAQCWWACEIWRQNPHRTHLKEYVPQAYTAWQRCIRYLANPAQLRSWALNGRQKQFLEDWQYCVKQKELQKILFQDDLLLLLADSSWLADIKLPPTHVSFHQFDDWNPAALMLIENLKKAGLSIELVMPSSKNSATNSTRAAYLYESEEQERFAALTWLKEQPLDARSAVIVPNMSTDFPLIKSQIHQGFEGDHSLLPLEQQRSWLAVSAGFPLSKHILIAQLLSALKAADYEKNAVISQESWAEYQKILPALALWDEHIVALKKGLQSVQWLVALKLSSEEYQAAHSFYRSLDELIGLNPQAGPLTSAQFIDFLELFLALNLFQPQSLTDKKMVLGLLEATALPWDAVWICQGSSKNFPPPLSPHPLLPYDWQAQEKLPQSCAEKEWRYFKALLTRLFQGVPKILITANSNQLADWAPLWQIFNVPQPVAFKPLHAHKTSKTIAARELFYPGAAQNPAKKISVSQFNAFTQCAFKGWASTLVGARPLQPLHPIFDPRVWGKLSHVYIQQKLQKSESELWSEEEFALWPKPLQQYATSQLELAAAELPLKLPKELLESNVLIEKSFSFSINKLQIDGRADLYSRESGRVIDIKTASLILSHWFHEYPQDWQGALYARAFNVSKLGLLRVAPGVLSYWECDVSDWLVSWDTQLEKYAQAWNQGDYTPAPAQPSHCQHCPWMDSCRYHKQEFES